MSKIFIVVIVFLTSSCSTIFCGDLDENLKEMQDSANSKYSAYVNIKHTPCEFFYTNITLKENKIDTNLIHSVHSILYNKTTGIGWKVLLVHDNNGEYLFSHNYENKIYFQTGD